MRIGIEINGVLRDTLEKFKQLYEKHLVDVDHEMFLGRTYNMDYSGNTEETYNTNSFEYGIISDVNSLDLMNHYKFQDKDELYSFMYEEYTMELFGHAPSTEMNTFNLLNEIYYDLRDEYNLLIVSDEIGKSKPASLFFLSKFGCLIEKILFYSEITKNQMWDEVDVLLTANPSLLNNVPNNKTVIKFETVYNKDVQCDHKISTLSEFKLSLEKISKSYV